MNKKSLAKIFIFLLSILLLSNVFLLFEKGNIHSPNIINQNNMLANDSSEDEWNLSQPIVSNIGSSTATVTTTVSLKEGATLEKYFLVVKNSDGEKIGKTWKLSKDGDKEIRLFGLIASENYLDCTIEATKASDETVVLATSPSFQFITNDDVVRTIKNPLVSDITKTSATVKVVVTNKIYSNEFKSYVLEVNDEEGNILGGTGELNSDGEQEIDLTNLETGHDYSNCSVIAFNSSDQEEVYATSEPFDFTTEFSVVETLRSPDVNNITKDGALVTTTVNGLSESNENLKDYFLEVKNGTSSIYKSSILTSGGEQSFKLINLSPNTKYDNCILYAYDGYDKTTILAQTTFSFETTKDSISQLSNAHAESMTYDSATIFVDTKSSSGSGELNNYSLIVWDIRTKEILGERDGLSKEGNYSIDIKNLEWHHKYDLYVKVEGTDIKEPVKSFSTKDSPVTVNQDSFLIYNKSITKNSFTFRITLNINDDYKDFNPNEDLHFYSQDTELKIEFLKVDSHKTFTFKAYGLKHHTKYNDFRIRINKSPDLYSLKKRDIVTKRDKVVFIVIVTIMIISILIIIGIIGLFIKMSKDKKIETLDGKGSLANKTLEAEISIEFDRIWNSQWDGTKEETEDDEDK